MLALAVETQDWAAVRAFVDAAKVRECCTAPPDAPSWMHEPDGVPYLCLGLPPAPAEGTPFRVFATGWTDIEGVMILMPEPDFPADLRASVVARSERALRDLLLAFPRGTTGLFYHSAAWALPVLHELFAGQPLPAREGYYAARDTFAPARTRLARRLGAGDYDVLRAHWSPTVWGEVMADGYTVFVSEDAQGLRAFCFHWPVAPGRHEVHGLQGVRDWSAGHAESVFSAATEDVLDRGLLPTCTACLASGPTAEVPLRLGYHRFYQVRQFLGVKRGSVAFTQVEVDRFFCGADRDEAEAPVPPVPGTPVPAVDLGTVRALATPEGRRGSGMFAAEGLTLVQRAIDDGLPVACIVYTGQAERQPEGLAVLQAAWRAGIPHTRVSDGVMGSLTPTRPVPALLAAVYARLGAAADLHLHPGSVLMVVEHLQNPDNLGMVLRTADAMGADALVVTGADPLHRQCVRAARGAVGRVPIRLCADLPAWLRGLREEGVRIVGASPRGAELAYQAAMGAPLALVVGNERDGLTLAALDACTHRVRIPMAPGQDSLNVGVAAGMLLYEAVRQRQAPAAGA